MFARMDANGDGVVDREEFRAVALRRFDTMDANKDGKIDAAEREAARDAMSNRMGPRGQRGGTPGGDTPPPPSPAANPNAGQ
jgi:Ca2+-binding EF-hand superfamily protein